MHWNHRVIDITHENGGEPLLTFAEVYYDEDGKPSSYCDPFFSGDDTEELAQLVKRLGDALGKPVLKPEDFNNSNSKETHDE